MKSTIVKWAAAWALAASLVSVTPGISAAESLAGEAGRSKWKVTNGGACEIAASK